MYISDKSYRKSRNERKNNLLNLFDGAPSIPWWLDIVLWIQNVDYSRLGALGSLAALIEDHTEKINRSYCQETRC